MNNISKTDVIKEKNDLKVDKKYFYKLVFILCLPIILQNFIMTLVNIVDTAMVSSLGYKAVAATGIANQYFFFFNMATGGLVAGSSLFISQFFGQKDFKNIKKITGFTCFLATIFALLFTLVIAIKPEFIVHIFTHDATVEKFALDYFNIIFWAYIPTAISLTITTCARSIRKPYLGLICGGIALIINIFLNYCLILGNLGFPKLGVEGSALATLIARLIEMSSLVIYIFVIKKDFGIRFSIKNIFEMDKVFLKKFISNTVPLLLNDVSWVLGTIAYSVAYSKIGAKGIAAGQIAGNVQNLFMVTGICIAIGSSIILGNELGSNNIKKAVLYSKWFCKLVTIIGIIMGAVLIISIPLQLKIFNVEPDMVSDMEKTFIIIGGLMFLKSFNTFLIIGALRSGGDTTFALIIESIGMWLIAIPITFIGAYHGYPIYVLVFLSYIEEFTKIIFALPRYRSKKWAVNIID